MDLPQIPGISEQTQLHLLTAWVLGKFIIRGLGSVFTTLRDGGGLKRMIVSIWEGEGMPVPPKKNTDQNSNP
jgi:hypothetical protein